MSKKQELITVKEAVKRYHVTDMTILRWIHSGKLKAIKKLIKVVRYSIPVENFKDMFVCRCLWCGKKFRPPRPARAKFCCVKHYLRYYERNCRKPKKA